KRFIIQDWVAARDQRGKSEATPGKRRGYFGNCRTVSIDLQAQSPMTLHSILTTIWNVLIAIAIATIFLYLHWRRWDSRYKSLGNGGVQTLFGEKNPRA